MHSGQLHECSYNNPQSSLHLVDRLITFVVTLYIVSRAHNYLQACCRRHHRARLGIRVATRRRHHGLGWVIGAVENKNKR